MLYKSQQLILRDNLKVTNVKSQTVRFYYRYFIDKYLWKRLIFHFFSKSLNLVALISFQVQFSC